MTCGTASLSTEKVTLNQRDYDKFSVACQEDVTCPTAEETLPIELALEARQQNKYENYSTSFFIRDISEFCMEARAWEAKMLSAHVCDMALGYRIGPHSFSFCAS